MGLETGNFIKDLNPVNPLTTDKRRQGDDHLRLIKQVLRNTFPNANGAINPTPAEFNALVGVTSGIQGQLDGKAAKSHNHDASAINAGILPTERGGTGVATSTGTGNNVLSAGPTFTGTAQFATVKASVDIILESDLRIKKNLTRINDALNKVRQINGYTFNVNGTQDKKAGVIAQEVECVLPEVVTNDGIVKGVAYGNLIALLIEAVKELAMDVEELSWKLKASS